MSGVAGWACKYPRCPGIATNGGYCEKHQSDVKTHGFDRKNKERLSFYGSSKWRKTRARKLSKNPICEICEHEFSTVVHHIKPAREYPKLRFTFSNLQAVCESCHNRESQKEALGK